MSNYFFLDSSYCVIRKKTLRHFSLGLEVVVEVVPVTSRFYRHQDPWANQGRQPSEGKRKRHK